MARSLAEHLGPSPAVVMRPSEERLRQRPRSGARDRISRGQQHEAVGATWRRGRRSRRRRRRGEEARAPARKRGRRKQRMSSCAPLVTGSHECCNGEAVGAAVNGVEKGRASAGDEEEEEVATARWEAGGRGRQRRGDAGRAGRSRFENHPTCHHFSLVRTDHDTEWLLFPEMNLSSRRNSKEIETATTPTIAASSVEGSHQRLLITHLIEQNTLRK